MPTRPATAPALREGDRECLAWWTRFGLALRAGERSGASLKTDLVQVVGSCSELARRQFASVLADRLQYSLGDVLW